MVGPVAVGAHPDLEERRLPLDDRPRGRRGEGLDPRPRPDEREAEREVDLALPAGALAVDDALPLRCDLRLAHPRLDDELAVLHRRGRDLVREPHALDLLLGLDRAGLDEKRRRVDRIRPEAVEPVARERRRLPDHPVRRLRPERELEPDRPVLGRDRLREVEDPRGRRARIGRRRSP